MNDIIDFSTMVVCVCVSDNAWAYSCLCVYLFISVCCVMTDSSLCMNNVYCPCMSMYNKCMYFESELSSDAS